ncbi:recombination-associated protein RdgC [Uliginosibacterium gangwonense]|uniref:recombination-associated protein RdgC n=1 Tax=Uliginosibacterium gangwonense TaxID=392736 RepID=UPI0003660E37|nr:recombination-associated protein RdgC [Uliginosibacterium gangwonense]
MSTPLSKHLIPYRLDPNWDMDPERLAELLSQMVFQPCGNQEPMRQGWENVLPAESGGAGLVHAVAGRWLVALGCDKRILPGRVVKQAALKRAAELEAQQGFKPGRKQMKEIAEAVTQELLPTAFINHSRVLAWFDVSAGWLMVLASSRTAAEPVLEHLYKCLEGLPIKLLNTEFSPCKAMTDWLAAHEAPNGFSIDDSCELRAVTDETSVVRYRHHSLEGEEIRDHIAQGKQVYSLGLSYADRVSFTLTERLEIKGLELLDITKTESKSATAQDAQEQFDVDFTLLALEATAMLEQLLGALGGETKDEESAQSDGAGEPSRLAA